jgi:tetratricopeptide (TPR) repeat protein
LRRAEEALADCDEALKLLPNQPEILDSRALAYWLLDEHDKAQQDLVRAWRLDPSRRTWQERFREFEGMF